MTNPPHADIPALLARASHLLEIAATNAETSDRSQPSQWVDDVERWHTDYQNALPALTRPYGAVVDIYEHLRPGDDPDASPGLLIPDEVCINGIPLLLTEEGPIIEQIDMSPPADGRVRAAKVTLTLYARRVRIDAKPTCRDTDGDGNCGRPTCPVCGPLPPPS